MIIQFIHTETDVPGPYKTEGGFKFKCVVIPKDFQQSVSNIEDEIRIAKSPLESILPDFAGYRSPEVGVFMTDEAFAALPKGWVFTANGQGTFAFGRLFTCGTNHGRPNTPFHQGFVFSGTDWTQLSKVLKQKGGGISPRPIDFAFAGPWLNPRGEVEVNAATITEEDFPFPEIRQAELSQIHGQAFFNAQDPLKVLTSFATAIYSNTTFLLPNQYREHFTNWVSLLTHLIPNRMAWRTLFSNLTSEPAPNAGPDSALKIGVGDGINQALPPVAANLWAKVVHELFEQGLDTELVDNVDRIASLFQISGVQNEDEKLRPTLTTALLAALFIELDLLDESEATGLANDAILALNELRLPLQYRSVDAFRFMRDSIDSGDRLIHAATNGDYCLGLLMGLPIANEMAEGGQPRGD